MCRSLNVSVEETMELIMRDDAGRDGDEEADKGVEGIPSKIACWRHACVGEMIRGRDIDCPIRTSSDCSTR